MASRKTALGALLSIALVCALMSDARPNHHRDFEPTPAWPLCGRIAENPPVGWDQSQGCPSTRWGDPDHADYPFSTTFGPRLLVSQNLRYDFHRGIDIPADVGTPIFAIARGVVRTAGNSSSFSDPAVQIRHFRPDTWGDCEPKGCYHSIYLHLTDWFVSVGDVVEKGQLIGLTGETAGFGHLHFEIREARPEDPRSSWQRDAVHPLRFMPYNDEPAGTQVTITNVVTSDPLRPRVEVEIMQTSAVRTMDINRIEVEVYDNSTKTSVPQSGIVADQSGFHVHPPFFDMELHNLEYTHKNSSAVPWSSFDGCPFSHEHGASYDANLHVCKHDPNDNQVGDFNGIRARPSHFNNTSSDYQLDVEFTELVGNDQPGRPVHRGERAKCPRRLQQASQLELRVLALDRPAICPQ